MGPQQTSLFPVNPWLLNCGHHGARCVLKGRLFSLKASKRSCTHAHRAFLFLSRVEMTGVFPWSVFRCGPCRMAFPHLSQLALKHCNSGLRIVGISSEPASDALRAFVTAQGKNINYTVSHSLLQRAINKPRPRGGLPK